MTLSISMLNKMISLFLGHHFFHKFITIIAAVLSLLFLLYNWNAMSVIDVRNSTIMILANRSIELNF